MKAVIFLLFLPGVLKKHHAHLQVSRENSEGNQMSEKIWLGNYMEGVPNTIDPATYESLVDMLEQSCEKYARQAAFTSMGGIITYGQLNQKTKAFATFLKENFNLKKGARVALMLPNLLQYPIAMFGALRAGMTVVNVNPLYTVRELVHQLNDAQIDVIVVVSNCASVVQQALPQTKVKRVIVTEVGDALPFPKSSFINFMANRVKKMVPAWDIPDAYSFTDVLKKGARVAFQPTEILSGDIAFLQYTGGTTGVAKGAMLTHRNLVANVEQMSAIVGPLIRPGEEVMITALPLYHVFSLTVNCLTFTKFGGLNVLITNPRDIPAFMKELQSHKFTAISAVNTLYNALLNRSEFAELDFSNLRMSLAGGMAVQKSVAERWHRITGCPMAEGYGLTEASPVTHVSRLDLSHYTGGIGFPLPSTDAQIRDKKGRALPVGEVGELWVKGPQVMRGYWQRPDETDKVIQDGWLATGDVAKMDESGNFFIVDRKKDMIIVSGFNVYPNEIEEALAMHDDILEVAVIGVPHPKSGEQVKAFVVSKNPALTKKDLLEHCRDLLTSYKMPKVIEFTDELPKSNVGKILRRSLRDRKRQAKT